jgi:hypothetical protein
MNVVQSLTPHQEARIREIIREEIDREALWQSGPMGAAAKARMRAAIAVDRARKDAADD